LPAGLYKITLSGKQVQAFWAVNWNAVCSKNYRFNPTLTEVWNVQLLL